jgi:hypothetical protein
MKRFHHHPDQKIIIQDGETLYVDSIENFQLDLGSSYEGLPEGFKERFYVQEACHILTTHYNEAIAQEPEFEFGNLAIVQINNFLTQQSIRLVAESQGGE